jgi:ribonuclease HI
MIAPDELVFFTESYALGSHATVSQSEMYAILVCSKYCISEGIVNRAVSICSDSRAALLALKPYTVSSRVVLQCRDSLQKLVVSNRVRLVWVPGHCGIHENKEADALARAGSSSAFVGRSLVFRWKLRVSGGGSESGY